MSKNTPTVQTNQLYYQTQGQNQVLGVDSPAWFECLDSTQVFAFVNSSGTFTARQEAASNGRTAKFKSAYAWLASFHPTSHYRAASG